MRRIILLVGFITAGAVAPARSPTAPAESVGGKIDLPEAIRFALEHNFAIRQARERIRAQEGVITTVTAAGLPTVSATGLFQRSNIPTLQFPSVAAGALPVFVPIGKYWRLSLGFHQTLYAGGGVQAARHGANLTRDAAAHELQAVINQTLLEVKIRFYDVLLAREQIKVQEQNLQLLDSELRDATVRYQVGTVSHFDPLRAEVAVANAKVPLITARNNHRLAVEELRRVLGAFPAGETDGQPLDVVGALGFEPVTADLQAALSAAHENRPELLRLRKLQEAAITGEISAGAGYYPSLALVGTEELRKGPSDHFGDSQTGWRLGPQAQWRVAGRDTAGKVQQAVARSVLAKLTEEESALAVQVEVRRAMSSLVAASELVRASQQSVAQAEEALRIAKVRFDSGTATQLDLLKVQVEVTTARTSQITALHAYNVSVAGLQQAIGVTEIEFAEPLPSVSLP
jgi:outer membrane protein TolC